MNRFSSTLKGTHGGRSTTWSTGDWASRRPRPNYVRTPCFGPERSMSLLPGRKATKAPGLTPQHDQPSQRDANLRGHQLSHNGTNKKGHPKPKGVRPKGPWDPEKGRTLNGLQTGLRSHPREYSTAVTTSSRRNVPGTADAPTTVRSSRMAGYATPHPQNTPQNNAHTVDYWRTR